MIIIIIFMTMIKFFQGGTSAAPCAAGFGVCCLCQDFSLSSSSHSPSPPPPDHHHNFHHHPHTTKSLHHHDIQIFSVRDNGEATKGFGERVTYFTNKVSKENDKQCVKTDKQGSKSKQTNKVSKKTKQAQAYEPTTYSYGLNQTYEQGGKFDSRNGHRRSQFLPLKP